MRRALGYLAPGMKVTGEAECGECGCKWIFKAEVPNDTLNKDHELVLHLICPQCHPWQRHCDDDPWHEEK